MRYFVDIIYYGSCRWYLCNKIIKGFNDSVLNNSYVHNKLYRCNENIYKIQYVLLNL